MAPPLYVFCVSEQQNVSHRAVWNTNWTAAQNRCIDTQTTTLLDKRSQCHTCSLKDYYSDIQDRAFGMRYVPYNWCKKQTVYVRSRRTDHPKGPYTPGRISRALFADV